MRNYQEMSNQQLASLLRQYRKSEGISCDEGHDNCGCSNVPTMDGNAACAQRVQEEIKRRKNES